MKKPRFLVWLIVIVTLFSIILEIPSNTNIAFRTPRLPFINKSIVINQTLAKFLGRDTSFKKGLDLEGGVEIVFRANMKDVAPQDRTSALTSAKAVIERRVNFFGVGEPLIQTATKGDDYRIIVEIPGFSNADEAINLVGTTAQLSFWQSGASSSAQTPSQLLPLGTIQTLGPDPVKTSLTGKDLHDAAVIYDPQTGQPEVQLQFTDEGSQKFGQITSANIGKRVAIVLDNVVIEAPTVKNAIVSGPAVISGGFTTDSAKQLAIQLKGGALPVPLTILEQHRIAATLGNQSVAKSIFAGLLGFLIIVIFMSVLYGRLGMIASLALIIYTLIVLGLFKLIPVTLTLAGIAGFILSIGMAVDANILIFERMREEKRAGRPKDLVLQLGFSRAWTSIRDSNISSLITGFILLYYGTGPVKGFAVTFIIGVLVSLFSAVVVTKTLLQLFRKFI